MTDSQRDFITREHPAVALCAPADAFIEQVAERDDIIETQRELIEQLQQNSAPTLKPAGGDCYKALMFEREPTLIDPFGQHIAVFTEAEDCQNAANALNTVADLAFAIGETIDQLEAYQRGRGAGEDDQDRICAALETLNNTSVRQGNLTTKQALVLLHSALTDKRVSAAGRSTSPSRADAAIHGEEALTGQDVDASSILRDECAVLE